MEEAKPRDCVDVMADGVKALIGAILVGLLLFAAFGAVGNVQFADALLEEAEEKVARVERAMLAFPIQYDATVTQPDADGNLRTRYYVRGKQ